MRAVVSRGKLVQSTRAKRLTMQVQLLNGEVADRVECLQPYGWSAVPKPGGDVLMLTVGGCRDDKVVLVVDDPAIRIRGLAAGEMGFSDGNTRFVVRATGGEISTPGSFNTQSDGPTNILAPTVDLGAYGAAFRRLIDERFLALYNAHVHTDPQGGVTSAPTSTGATGSHTTTNVQAS